MRPYYDRDGITIYNTDALGLLADMKSESVSLIVTDPPYYKVKGEWWDKQWDTSTEFLAWIGRLCDEFRRVLKPNGSLYVFASPQMCDGVKAEVAQRFNVLNTIRWYKDDGWHNKAEKKSLRSFLEPWEGIVLAEMWWADDHAAGESQYFEQCRALHKNVYAPIGRYIQQERERAGLTRNQVEVGLGYISSNDPMRGTALCYRWEEGSSLPTKEAYYRLREFLNAHGGNYLVFQL